MRGIGVGGAVRCNLTMKAIYCKPKDGGELFKVAITAVMQKLIVLINVLIGQYKEWQPIAA